MKYGCFGSILNSKVQWLKKGGVHSLLHFAYIELSWAGTVDFILKIPTNIQ